MDFDCRLGRCTGPDATNCLEDPQVGNGFVGFSRRRGDPISTRLDRMFSGNGMRTGDGIPALASWESNSDPADIPGLEIVADAGSLSGVGPSLYGATIYPGPRRDLLFNAASIWWAQGLTSPAEHMLPWSHGVRPHGPGRRVDRITANLLARAPGTGLI